jgi:hypothetical protein
MPTKELRFSEFLSAGNKPETQTVDVVPESVDETPTDTPVASETTETLAPEDEGQGQPSQLAIRFEDVLKSKGFPVEDNSDPAELYEHVISRAVSGSQAMLEAANLRRELEALRASQASPQQTATAPPQTEQPQGTENASQQIARRFRELQKYDPLLENYVERDDSGYVKPIASFGQVSIDAARAINDFERSSREQADLLLRNPMAVVEDSRDIIAKIAEEKARELVEQRFSEMQAKAEQEQRAFTQQEVERQSKTALTQWHEQHKSSLFHLDERGEPRPDFFGSGDVAWTKTGQAFREKLNQLRLQLPDAPEITLRQLAYEFASVGSQASPAAMQQEAPPIAPPAEPPVTQAQQRRLLADSRQPIPNQNTAPADVGQIAKTFPTLRLANMVRMNPENAERVSGWRN